jgi:hypothetical protein
MERKKQVPGPDGVLRSATEIGFRPTGEYWNEYLLDDGTVVRLRLVVTSVNRFDDLYDGEGNPAYVVNSTNVISVSAPEDLRKGPK